MSHRDIIGLGVSGLTYSEHESSKVYEGIYSNLNLGLKHFQKSSGVKNSRDGLDDQLDEVIRMSKRSESMEASFSLLLVYLQSQKKQFDLQMQAMTDHQTSLVRHLSEQIEIQNRQIQDL